ncbi:hypothetical protein CXF35_00545 [Corynebacterium bovis]|uniref:Uncharacterized protein n=1 Tax=Corynebacterium bovis TaxID=36808 RepID=A0A426Q839_9CORY|nr:hypothetical protein [Corynebacterium bovis]RRO93142.1 hypothetical protein CXF40_01170 [Corynebacterium bovis]RRO98548.1 hypothetical protein CXF32_00670 [Corynebacterium bovis]RRQ00527.1 hypothetical protein CXF31_00515 [Corynebacterium bovis]RRQ01918.1 hypothetical protein CXF41_02650 [Corynebacterium bovis]RRQ03956.1 hypothetical protein CXF39_03050 [Corynebacterium bovis]
MAGFLPHPIEHLIQRVGGLLSELFEIVIVGGLALWSIDAEQASPRLGGAEKYGQGMLITVQRRRESRLAD